MKKQVLLSTLKKDRNLFILFAIMTVVNSAVFMLYHMLIEAFLYAEVIIVVFVLLLFIIDFIKSLKNANEMKAVKYAMENGNLDLPQAESYSENQYQEIISELKRKIDEIDLNYAEEKRDMNDWYTLWVHQIKTPIAILKLKVPDGEKEILSELFRIEEYADMALSYIRLGSEHNDLLIKEYELDDLIRETLRKYAYQFIAKKIKLDYTPTDKVVITDQKWFLCILEQYISNAVKYTESGTVTVSVNDEYLSVSDTGVGISKEDMPRIFEKGYTGINGRTDVKSSGLGLYLSAKAAKLIGVKLSVDSTAGQGSTFKITFPE